MSSRRTPRQLLVAVLLGVLVGGGLMAITPAGAEVSQAAATSWKKIWKKNLKPLADRRYYTKSASKKTFATKAESAAAASAAAAAAQAGANAATDGKLGGYYTKAQGDAKYAPYPSLIKGSYFMTTTAAAAGAQVGADISFGYTASVAPIVHYIASGAVPPAGCSGTVEAPDAAVGHLCVFEQVDVNASNQQIYDVRGIAGVSSRMGALLNATSTAAGGVFVYGSWAMRPASVSASADHANRQPGAGTPSLGR